MKRFILFGYSDYYPSGGMGDIIGDYDSMEELKEAAKKESYDNFDFLDFETREYGDVEL